MQWTKTINTDVNVFFLTALKLLFLEWSNLTLRHVTNILQY